MARMIPSRNKTISSVWKVRLFYTYAVEKIFWRNLDSNSWPFLSTLVTSTSKHQFLVTSWLGRRRCRHYLRWGTSPCPCSLPLDTSSSSCTGKGPGQRRQRRWWPRRRGQTEQCWNWINSSPHSTAIFFNTNWFWDREGKHIKNQPLVPLVPWIQCF